MAKYAGFSKMLRAGGALMVAAALAVTVMPGAANAQAAIKRPTINTFKAWDGSEAVEPFGCPNTTTYGQVVTVPAGKEHLQKFKFWMNDYGATGSMVVRGEVYAWDGSKATGAAVFESKPRTLNFANGLFDKVTFNAFGAHVDAGAQYVIFLSIDKDYEECVNDYVTWWGALDDTTYPGGTFVFQNNGGDESQWTAAGWDRTGLDAAFKVYLT